MTAISSKTRAEIKGYLEGFIDGLVDEYKGRSIVKPDNAAEYLSRFSANGELAKKTSNRIVIIGHAICLP